MAEHTGISQSLTNFRQLAEECLSRCHLIAGFTETPGSITRTFLSGPMRECTKTVASWMADCGMQVSMDAIGNLRGLSGSGKLPRLVIGSHLDTVPAAGAYDGVLGVCIALAMIQALAKTDLPFDIELLGFSEEEGVRFRMPFLGSLAAVGQFDSSLLDLQDQTGCTMGQAMLQFGLDPSRIPEACVDPTAFAYLEFHIEQGPVLDSTGESLAAVYAIAGQSRLEITFIGQANHAGTTPMELRHDALCAAAEWITLVELETRRIGGLVATTGRLQIAPGASNIIAGEVRVSLDVRHSSDETRMNAVRNFCQAAGNVARRRGLHSSFDEHLDQSAVRMDDQLVSVLEKAAIQVDGGKSRMVSGAGHDAMIMARRVPSAMLFVRSIGGISHHPDEAVHLEDVEKAIRAGVLALKALAVERAHPL